MLAILIKNRKLCNKLRNVVFKLFLSKFLFLRKFIHSFKLDFNNLCQVELFDWRGEDLSSKKDGGIIRRIIQNGEGYLTPNDGAMVDGMYEVLTIFLFLLEIDITKFFLQGKI